MHRLDAAARARLTLVVAPAGSGKTTALAQWHALHAAAGRRIAWLRLDARHDEPLRCAQDLLAAVRVATAVTTGVAGGDRPGRLPLASAHGVANDADIHRLADDLIDALVAEAPELVVVLDDIDALRQAEVRQLLGLLVADAPPSVHWIACGRRADVMDTTQLQLDGELRLIDAEALRLDAAAVQQIGRGIADIALSRSVADAIVQATEGWAAGVVMAIDATPEAADPPAIGGDRVDVAAYFEAKVMAPLPPRLRRFLVDSSVVDELCGELCNALLGIEDGQSVLEALAGAHCFLVPLDAHAGRFRYQRLFHAFLRSRLRAEASRGRGLHERASRWFAGRQRDDEALVHAFESGQEEGCAELLASGCAARLRDAGDLRQLVDWCERLPRARLVDAPAIAMPCADALSVLGRFEDAAALIAELRRAGRVRAERLDVLAWLLASLSGRDAERHAERVEAEPPTALDSAERGLFLTIKAYALVRQNRFSAAWRCAMRASELLAPRSAFGHGQAQVVAVLAERGQGDLRSATQRAAQLYALANAGRRNATWVNAAVGLAHVRYDENRLGEAEALGLEALPLLELGASTEHRLTLLCTLARLYSAQGRVDDAERCLEHLQSRLDAWPEPRFLAQLCAEKIRLALAHGRLDAAERVAAECDLEARIDAGSARSDEGWERYASAWASLLIGRRDHRAAATVLIALRDGAHDAGNAYRVVGHEAMLASALWHAGDRAAALKAVHRAFARSRGAGFLRTHFDDAPGLGRIVAAAVEERQLGEALPRRTGRRLRTLIESSGSGHSAPPSRPQPDAAEALTQRELDMLRMMAKGLNNLQIGAQSRIAVSTVKWHVKNVYAKLGATSRVTALARARERRLIDD